MRHLNYVRTRFTLPITAYALYSILYKYLKGLTNNNSSFNLLNGKTCSVFGVHQKTDKLANCKYNNVMIIIFIWFQMTFDISDHDAFAAFDAFDAFINERHWKQLVILFYFSLTTIAGIEFRIKWCQTEVFIRIGSRSKM